VENLLNASGKIITIVLIGWSLYFRVLQQIFYGSISKGFLNFGVKSGQS
jgi:hypothetical protein